MEAVVVVDRVAHWHAKETHTMNAVAPVQQQQWSWVVHWWRLVVVTFVSDPTTLLAQLVALASAPQSTVCVVELATCFSMWNPDGCV